jgi:hypothetical protein
VILLKDFMRISARTTWMIGHFFGNSASISIGRPNCAFHFQKRRQLFIRVHDETLSVAAMRVHNPDRSPVGINR